MRNWVIAAAIVSLIGAPVLAQAQQNSGQRGGITQLARVFMGLDLNKDGQVTSDEAKQVAVMKFLAVDSNRDQIITLEEFAASLPRLDVNTIARRFVMLDIDGNGQLSPQEHSRQASDMFAFVDTDNNGVLTVQEMESVRGRLPQR